MNKQYLTISKGEHLGDVLDTIPTNTIVCKTLTGCGATTSEILAPRHSIIIEPNVPVIMGKASKHPNILGVWEGITIEDIEAYLNTTLEGGCYKIMTTPESYPKVHNAITHTKGSPYKDWFLLFDECERTVQDVGFRSSITAPIDDFFRYKHKAMVSATPIIPSDPRFEQQGFRMIVFKPDYDYKHTLHLIHTNNTPIALRQEIERRMKAGDKVCIFFNAVESIGRLILTYNIKDRTNIYCGEDGVKTLKAEGFSNAFSSLTPLAPRNFFTSRFYSAVDIDVEPTDKVSVIMVSDYSLGRYSLIDPTTEAVQIVGRFRAGVEYICHIINTSNSPECVGVENVKERLNGGENVYNAISQITPSSFYESGALTQALERMDYSRFVESDGSRNHFMWDNATNEESVRSYYEQFSVIEEVYKHHFKVNVASSMHKYGSNSPLKKAEKMTTADDVLRVLTEYYLQHTHQEAEEIIAEMMNTLRTFGADNVKEKGYNFEKLKSTARQKKCEEQLDSEEAFGYIYKHIKSGDTISISKANGIVADMVETLSIPYTKNITTSLLKRYFDFTYTRTNKERKIIVGKPTRADIYH